MMIRLDSAAVNAPATHALLVSTQCHENYAFDAEGRLDTENPYWKAKGGSEYLVSCRTLDVDSTSIEQLIVLDRVRDQIECDNGGFQEHVIGWRIVPVAFDVAGHIDPATDDYGYADFLRSSLTRLIA